MNTGYWLAGGLWGEGLGLMSKSLSLSPKRQPMIDGEAPQANIGGDN